MTSPTNSFHESFTAGQLLPLRWLRLPLLVATLGLSAVTIAVGAQALDKSAKLQRQIRRAGDATHVSVNFDMNNIQSACIVLTIFASILALVSLTFSIALAYDWIHYLMRPKGHRGLVEKEHPDDTARRPFSTRTLNWQTVLLSFLSLWMLAILIPSTVLSRAGVGRIEVNDDQLPSNFFIDTRYWDYGFLRCVAAAPWFSFIFSVPASIVSWFAWRFQPTRR